MTAPFIHAPDGGILGRPLCESPAGDVTGYERFVDCPDCLDALETAGWDLRQRMRAHGFQFTSPERPASPAPPAPQDALRHRDDADRSPG